MPRRIGGSPTSKACPAAGLSLRKPFVTGGFVIRHVLEAPGLFVDLVFPGSASQGESVAVRLRPTLPIMSISEPLELASNQR
jgi:hypothetical protein